MVSLLDVGAITFSMFLETCFNPPATPASLTAAVKSLKSSPKERSSFCVNDFAWAKKDDVDLAWMSSDAGRLGGGSVDVVVARPVMVAVGEDGSDALTADAFGDTGGISITCSGGGDVGVSNEGLGVDAGVVAFDGRSRSVLTGEGEGGCELENSSVAASASDNSIALTNGRSSFQGSATQFGSRSWECMSATKMLRRNCETREAIPS